MFPRRERAEVIKASEMFWWAKALAAEPDTQATPSDPQNTHIHASMHSHKHQSQKWVLWFTWG